MSLAGATLGPSAYWYLTRGSGAVSLVLLTIAVVVGILGPLRVTAARWPRFAIDTVHRDVSLLVVVFLVIHIVTSVLDSFAPISLTAAVIPFISSYRPLWLGLGTLAFDIILALIITSLVRRRLGYGPWRAVHWLAYASFPVAVFHGLGTGSDTKIWWMLLLTTGCAAAVVIATGLRVARAEKAPAGLRPAAFTLSLAAPVALIVFALVGPLAHGWAKRAGTPASLLGHAPTGRVIRTSAPGPTAPGPTAPGPSAPVGPAPKAFSASISGAVRQSTAAGGAVVDLDLHLSGGVQGRLRVRLAGAPIPGGGLSMVGSQVDLLTKGMTAAMAGTITSLQGTDMVAHVTSRSGSLTLHARLNINSQTNSVTGLVNASPGGGRQ